MYSEDFLKTFRESDFFESCKDSGQCSNLCYTLKNLFNGFKSMESFFGTTGKIVVNLVVVALESG